MHAIFHRTKYLVLIVVGVAALAGGPATGVASAEPVSSSGYDCTSGKTWFDQRVTDYNKLKDSNPKAATDAKKDAQDEKNRATTAGCDTSGWTVPLRITTSFPYAHSPVSRVSVASQSSGGNGTTGSSITPVARSGSSRAM